MNLDNNDLKLLRGLLSKEDRDLIASNFEISRRTIDAILQGDRYNNQVEIQVLNTAILNFSTIQEKLKRIITKNPNILDTKTTDCVGGAPQQK